MCIDLLFSMNDLLQSDKDTREDIQKVFNLFDDDQTGKISLRNLKRVAKELGETMSGTSLRSGSLCSIDFACAKRVFFSKNDLLAHRC